MKASVGHLDHLSSAQDSERDMGSALMGSLQSSGFWTDELFGYSGAPGNLLLYSQKCQGVPFSPICGNLFTFAAAPLMLTPFVRNQGLPAICIISIVVFVLLTRLSLLLLLYEYYYIIIIINYQHYYIITIIITINMNMDPSKRPSTRRTR